MTQNTYLVKLVGINSGSAKFMGLSFYFALSASDYEWLGPNSLSVVHIGQVLSCLVVILANTSME